jgi:nitrite reductase/ring-hydroxylating ferredoxin subunit
MSEDAERQCESCFLNAGVDRRAFMRNSAMGALAAVGIVLTPSRASALAASFVIGRGARSEKSYPIPAADGVAIDRDESVIICRFENRGYAFSLACPHQNTALRWDAKARRFQCPKHRSRYQPSGVFIEGRATRGLDRFAVTRAERMMLVNLDALYREDQHAAAWASAFIELAEK